METSLIDLGSRYKQIEIVPIGDVHIGHKECDEHKFEQVLDYVAKTRNCYLCGTGDWMEFSYPGMKIRGAMYEQKLNPSEQMDKMREYIKPLKDKLLFMINGNHEMRLWKDFGISPIERLSHEIDKPEAYAGNGGFFAIKHHDKVYGLACLHGASGGINPRYEFEKMEKSYRGVDAYLLAHNHDLFIDQACHFDFDSELAQHERKTVYYVRTGSFVDYAQYAMVTLMRPKNLGCPVITIDSITKTLTVKILDI